MRNALALLITAITLLLAEQLLAQGCCTAGSPSLGSLQTGLLQNHQLGFSAAYEFTRLATAYQGSQKIRDPLGREAEVGNLSVEFGYGLSDRLSLHLVGNYSNRRREINFDNGASFVSQGRGFGDLVALLKFGIWRLNLADQRELALGVGVKIPTGQFRLRENGVRLSYDLQPGTGSWDPLIWLYAFKGFLPKRFNFFGSATLRFPTENPEGYKIGRELSYFAGSSFRCCNPLDVLLQIRGRHASGDHFQGYQLPSTGGTWLFFVPAVNVNLTNQIALQVQYQQPLYFRVTGQQLVQDRVLALAAFYNIGF
jgi:hypothetical protein